MRRILLIHGALLVWATLLLSAAPAWAEGLGSVHTADTTRATGSVLKGTVLSAANKPVAARVFLQSADGTAPQALRADASGHFRSASLPAGLYDVRAEAGGNWSPWAHNVVLKNGKEAEITLKLSRRTPPKAPK